MDASRFDRLTKRLAVGTSRRTVIRGMAGGGAAAIATQGMTLAQDATPEATPAAVEQESWLVVLNFRSATTSTTEEMPGQVVFDLKGVDLDALAFTDRPARQTAEWSPQDIVDEIAKGFEERDLLNAVLTSREPRSDSKLRLSMALVSATYDSDAESMTVEAVPFGGDIDGTQLSSDDDIPTELRAGYLYIDNVSGVSDSSCQGQPDGTICNDSNCLGVSCFCKNGVCTWECYQPGAQCNDNDFCCSRWCDNGTCKALEPDGQPCTSGIQCESQCCGCDCEGGNCNCCCSCL